MNEGQRHAGKHRKPSCDRKRSGSERKPQHPCQAQACLFAFQGYQDEETFTQCANRRDQGRNRSCGFRGVHTLAMNRIEHRSRQYLH